MYLLNGRVSLFFLFQGSYHWRNRWGCCNIQVGLLKSVKFIYFYFFFERRGNQEILGRLFRGGQGGGGGWIKPKPRNNDKSYIQSRQDDGVVVWYRPKRNVYESSKRHENFFLHFFIYQNYLFIFVFSRNKLFVEAEAEMGGGTKEKKNRRKFPDIIARIS